MFVQDVKLSFRAPTAGLENAAVSSGSDTIIRLYNPVLFKIPLIVCAYS